MSKRRTILLVALTASMLITASACTGTPSNSSSQTSTIISEIESSKVESSELESKETSSEEASSAAPVAAKPGESVQNSNLKISLTSAKMYDKFTMGEGDFTFDTTPDEGKKFLVLFFEAENISDEDQYINMFYYESYLDDTKIDFETLLVDDIEGMGSFTGDIASGKKLSGYVAYQVGPDWEKLEFTYTDGVTSDSDKYNFIVTPGDLA